MRRLKVMDTWDSQRPALETYCDFPEHELFATGSVIKVPPNNEVKIVGEVAHRHNNTLFISVVGGGEYRVEFVDGLPSVPVERVRRMKISLLAGNFQGNAALDLVGGEMGHLENGRTYYFQPDILPSPLCFKLKDVIVNDNRFQFVDELTGTMWTGEYIEEETTSSTTTRTTTSGYYVSYTPNLNDQLIWGSGGRIPSNENETPEEMVDRIYGEVLQTRDQLGIRRRGYIDMVNNPLLDDLASTMNAVPLPQPIDFTRANSVGQDNNAPMRALVGCVMSRIPIFKENAAFETTVTDFAQGTDIIIGDIIKMHVETMVAEDRDAGKYVISTAQGIFTITFLT